MRAPNITAEIISMAVAVLFTSGIPLWYVVRGRRRKPDFMVGGIGVAWGKMNKPSKELVEQWVRELTTFWQGKVVRRAHDQMTEVTITPFMLMQAFDGMLVICHDEDHFSFWGRMVTGYAFGLDVAIGFKGTDMVYTASLFRHEVSHQILDAAGVLWDEARHHKIYQDAGLGA